MTRVVLIGREPRFAGNSWQFMWARVWVRGVCEHGLLVGVDEQ